MPRDMIENERSTAITPGEAVEEKVSLSDRFGLWLGFHNCDQDTYFAMIEGYAARYGLEIEARELHAEAREWSVTRGARSGRVAWQFIQDLAGRLGCWRQRITASSSRQNDSERILPSSVRLAKRSMEMKPSIFSSSGRSAAAMSR
jgi:hypothetical protein